MTENNTRYEDIEDVSQGTGMLWLTASWCAPCGVLRPIIEKLQSEEAAKIVKVDIDYFPDVSSHYGVLGVPTLVFFKDGEITERWVGLIREEALREKIANNL